MKRHENRASEEPIDHDVDERRQDDESVEDTDEENDEGDTEEENPETEEETTEEREAAELGLIIKDDELKFDSKVLLGLFNGTILSNFFKNNWKFCLLAVVLTVIYVGLVYQTRDKMIENDRLNKELLDWKYKSLTRSSELRERTLRSNIEGELRDTALRAPTDSPYQLTVEKEENE